MGKTPWNRHTRKLRAPGSLAEATEALVNACGGPLAASQLPGCYVSRSMLDKYMDDDDPENLNKSMGAKLAAYLESVAELPAVSAWMAAQSGHVVVPLPDVEAMDLSRFLSSFGKEAGDVFNQVGQALADDRLDAAERHRLVTELQDVIEACAAAVHGLTAGDDR